MAKSLTVNRSLKLYGHQQKLQADERSDDPYFSLSASYSLSATRNKGEACVVSLHSKDYIELVFDDATTWFGNFETLKEIFPEEIADADEIPELPRMMYAEDQARSSAHQAAISHLRIYSQKENFAAPVKIATALEQKNRLYRIDESFELKPIEQLDITKPLLLLIHGLSGSTQEAFAGLTTGDTWNELLEKYGSNIVCFEHQVFTKTPLQNALDLLSQLPDACTLDMVSHSSGGLIAETIMRFTENSHGFLKESLALFSKEKRTEDIKAINALQLLIAQKPVKINRFVRVACPARGMSLLGKRADLFLNVLCNLVQRSKGPQTPSLSSLRALMAVALAANDNLSMLPGLEAMAPGSVFLKGLNTIRSYNNDTPEGFDNMLIVISGSNKSVAPLTALSLILPKFLFRWGANDWMADTPSMYQGARRKGSLQYFLDDGHNVNHFNYFTNKKTQDALMQALTATTARIPTFKEMDVENYTALSRGIFGLEGGQLRVNKATGKRPVVLLLPGIMGSFLEKSNRPLWINYFSFMLGGLSKLDISNDDIVATGLIRTAYKDLVAYLSASYDVEVFPFDWRKPISHSGAALNERMIELQKMEQPVLLVGHSMGGLIIREMAIHFPDTWNWLNMQPKFKTILLGTPWLGSYRIAHVLSGMDAIIKQLDTIDFTNTRGQLINMFVKFPGLLALLPIADGDNDFSDPAEWERFAKATGMEWKIPDAKLLHGFSLFKKQTLEGLKTLNHERIIYVAGKDETTVNGYFYEHGSLKFKTTAEGDQSVTWQTGIPAGLDRQTALYYTTASHGGLTTKKKLFQGIKDLLDTGTTHSPEFSRIPQPTSRVARGLAKESYNFEINEKSIESNLLGLDVEGIEEAVNAPILKVSVSKGDLIYANFPVLIGHFANDGVYGAEAIANKYLKNDLRLKHALGIYPGMIGSHNFFQNKDSAFKGCIVTGLGDAETLNGYQLAKTVEQAVADYLLTFCRAKVEAGKIKTGLGISTLLVGAGYGGMAIESSVRAVMAGVVNANDKIQKLTGIVNLYIDELEFVELFEDKAITCFYSLTNFINGNSDGMNIAWKEKKIKRLPGFRKRLLVDNNITWWQRLSVVANDSPSDHDKVLSYYSSTNNAREEKKELHHNLPLIQALLDEISIKKNWSFEKAKAIFELLIPGDFKENIRRNSPIIWVLDKFTASFPWELLQTGNATEKPLCVSAGMIRQLATSEFKTPNPIKNNNALVIGDPNLQGFTQARQLEGAEREARLVFDKLKATQQLTIDGPLINASSDEILTALFKQDYKILHFAGHGFFDEHNPAASGMLIGKMKESDEGMFLTPHHINQLPSTPEFVFINCCFLGRINPYAEAYSANRFKLAANIGTQLIENGVKAVIVAGWEVDDSAALAFSEIFYDRMLSGYNFGEAVLEARKFIYNKFRYTNTWGAFQCYGQQHYTFDLQRARSSVIKTYDISQEAENDLDNLLSKTEVAFYEPDELLIELRAVSKAIDEADFDSPELRQKEAQAYMELNDFETSGTLYNKLFKTENASFDVKALENYQNIIVNKAVRDYFSCDMSEENKIADIEAAIDTSITNLNYLLEIWKTGERFALIAGAYKRKALVMRCSKKNEEDNKLKTIEAAALHYRNAFEKLQNSYSFSNWILMEIFILKKKKQRWGQQVERAGQRYQLYSAAEIEQQLKIFEKAMSQEDADLTYWKLSEIVDVTLCRYLLKPGDQAFKNVCQALRSLWKITGSKNKKEKQIANLRILAQFAAFCNLTSVKKKLDVFLKEVQPNSPVKI
ncbi:CHAT domain-containing protein [Niabella insulamsoli]|uniref:CHAT domain-containing protein n=1 Tax=Niabella insulamsoli TaxID=3144874 RepID=UPI0031FC768D